MSSDIFSWQRIGQMIDGESGRRPRRPPYTRRTFHNGLALTGETDLECRLTKFDELEPECDEQQQQDENGTRSGFSFCLVSLC